MFIKGEENVSTMVLCMRYASYFYFLLGIESGLNQGTRLIDFELTTAI